MKRILVCGYYGFGNAGDDAILTAVVGGLRRRVPDAEITVVTYPFGDTAAVRRSAGVAAVDGRRVDDVRAALTGADLLVVGGGGLLQDYLPSDLGDMFGPRQSNLAFWAAMGLMARLAGVPVATWSVGIGPLTTPDGRRAASLLLGLCGLVSVRDPASAAAAAALGVPPERIVVAADPALLLDPPPPAEVAAALVAEDLPAGPGRRVVVAPRPWPGGWVPALAAALDELVVRLDADVVFLPFEQSGRGLDGDLATATTLAAAMTAKHRRGIVVTPLSPEEKLGVVAGADLVIGMRLHSLVFAAVAGVPAVGLAYDPKVAALMADLDRPDLSLDLADLSAGALVSAAAAATALPRAGLVERRDVLRARAAAAEEAVARFLADPVTPPIGPEAAAAAARAGVARGAELAAVESERDGALARATRAEAEHAALATAYDAQAAEFQAFRDARLVRAATSLWTLRDRLRPGDRPAPVPAPPRTDRRSAEESLRAIIAEHDGAPHFVVCAPGIAWDVDLFQRPQQMARAFARLGLPVLYQLEKPPPDGFIGYRPQEPGVYVGYLPEADADVAGLVPRPLLLTYVYNFPWGTHLTDPVTVYEHIDNLEVFEHVFDRSLLSRWHERALAEADVVVASATELLADVAPARPDALLVPNGVDVSHFRRPAAAVPDDLRSVREEAGILVGYYGALAEWFDYDLVAGLAERRPDVRTVLIGPDYDGSLGRSGLLGRDTVRWLGPRPYTRLPDYLASFDVATIPFRVSPTTHAVSPLKLFEYMAGGKPVVTTPLRECVRYRPVIVADGVDGFSRAIDTAMTLGADPAYRALLGDSATANDWAARARAILDAVADR